MPDRTTVTPLGIVVDHEMVDAAGLVFRATHLAGAVIELLTYQTELPVEEFLHLNCILDACRDHLRDVQAIIDRRASKDPSDGSAE